MIPCDLCGYDGPNTYHGHNGEEIYQLLAAKKGRTMTTKKPEATVLVQARIPADLHAWLQKWAAKEGLSMNKAVRAALESVRAL